jgi:hypothetical protein
VDETKVQDEAAEREPCGHTDEEHEAMEAGDFSFGDLLAAITGQRPVTIRSHGPFAVIQMIPHPEEPDRGYGLDIQGGNMPNRETLVAMLLDTAVQMCGGNGEDEDRAVSFMDEIRERAGLRSLRDHAWKDIPDEEPAAEPEPATN